MKMANDLLKVRGVISCNVAKAATLGLGQYFGDEVVAGVISIGFVQ